MNDDLGLELRSATGVPFYRQIVDQMTDRIVAGELPPGDRIPSVRELAAALTVSLITTRRAYAELESAGLVERRRGQGTFVARRPKGAAARRLRSEVERELRSVVHRALKLGIEPATLRESLDAAVAEHVTEER